MVISESSNKKFKQGNRFRRRHYRVNVADITYKDVELLRQYLSDRAKIQSAHHARNSYKNQHHLKKAIERARFMSLLPYSSEHITVTRSLVEQKKVNTEEAQQVVVDDDIQQEEASVDVDNLENKE